MQPNNDIYARLDTTVDLRI